MLWDAAVSCRCRGDDHSGGCGVGAQRLWLLWWHRLKGAERCEGLGGTRGSCGQVRGRVSLWYSTRGQWEVFSKSHSGARCKTSGRGWCCWHVVSWCCYKEGKEQRYIQKKPQEYIRTCVWAPENVSSNNSYFIIVHICIYQKMIAHIYTSIWHLEILSMYD